MLTHEGTVHGSPTRNDVPSPGRLRTPIQATQSQSEQNRWTVSSRVWRSTGFLRTSAFRSEVLRSARTPAPVITTTGIPAKHGSATSLEQSSNPFIPGIMRSSRIKRGSGPSCKHFSASVPSDTEATAWPRRPSTNAAVSRMSGSSSTTSTQYLSFILYQNQASRSYRTRTTRRAQVHSPWCVYLVRHCFVVV